MVKDSIEVFKNSKLHMENELQILSGDYMGQPKVLWSASMINNMESLA